MEMLSKTDKVTRILILYHKLLGGEHINKSAFSLEHNITERSFDRDIEDIRLFLSEIFSSSELLFDKESGTYYLAGEQPQYIERVEAAVIAKILLSSCSLRYDEMMGLLHSLFTTVSMDDMRVIRGYLCQDIKKYTSPVASAFLKVLGDLYEVIQRQRNIEIKISDGKGNLTMKLVSPLEIKLMGNTFYLIASDVKLPDKIAYYPVEQILGFT